MLPHNILMPLEPKCSGRAGCFHCKSTALRPVVVLAIEGYPPGHSRHNIGYAHDAVFVCDDCGHGYAEQRRHDCFDFEEVWDQDRICPIHAEDIARLNECLLACPNPFNESCACPVHDSLRKSWESIPVDASESERLSIRVSGGLPQLYAQH
jgi:hypothetical protein